jgi:phospholipid/cholesterol/gamma-HCH transport system substrate-binding protein
MKVKFNKFEKIAGLFVLVAIFGIIVASISIGIKKGWFSSRLSFQTTMTSAEGIHPGTTVQMSGLRAGSVDDVELVSASEVKVRFTIIDKFAAQIKKDSIVQVFRPFIIGDKVLEVTVGSEGGALPEKSGLPIAQTTDIMDLLSGRKMSSFFTTFDHMAESLRIFGEAFSDPERSKSLVKMVDNLNPLIKNMNTMAMQVNKVTDAALKQKRLETMLDGLSKMTEQLNTVLPAFQAEVPDLGKQMGQLVSNLNVLTTEFRKLTPAIAEIAPDLPRTSRRAVEALDETVVLLKAMQRSWLIRGNVKDVKEEEEKARMPASK